TLGHGGCRYLCKLLGCGESTLTRGRSELKQLAQHGDPADGRVRREGAGQPKKETAHPELPDELENILKQRTAGDPKNPSVHWTHLTVAALARRLSKTCVSVSWPVVNRLCQERNLKKRRQVDSVTKSPSRNRDEQFRVLDRLRNVFRSTKDAIFSIDSKQKEMLGDVSRPGLVLADGPVEMLDHPLPSYSKGEVITHGIYDTQCNSAHMNLSVGHDTGAFSCASFQWFWEQIGRCVHKTAERILLLMDCGGSNSFRSNVFKYELCRVSSEIGLPIRVAHFPVYCSKYNPIERRAFPWVEQAYSGQIFTTMQQMADAIERIAKTATGFRTTAHVMEEQFRPATKRAKKEAQHISVEHPESPEQYNYRVTPEILQ
ncbi:ISAzo13 family transposase, partial [Rhodopirellula sp. SWK7]|uniref:ISAzo13 family transposase n=1 Tax=Rhodopirellula sp. SWK7 TaxID=595460 RepID=UPI00118183CD